MSKEHNMLYQIDYLFVENKQEYVIMCFTNLQCYVVWVGTHNISPNAFSGEYPINNGPQYLP